MMECEEGDAGDSHLAIPIPDNQVHEWSRSGMAFLPSIEQVGLCQDKAKTAEMLGDLAPKTYWLRDTHGAGGAGAQMLTNYLPGRNYSVEYVFTGDGKVACFQKQRLSYSVKERTEGIENRGSSAVSVCTDRTDVWVTAMRSLNLLRKATGTPLYGFYGVDLKEDENGVPKVTEINAGRLLTASYSYFWLTGYNLPLVGVKAFFGEEQPELPAYPKGYGIIRQVDQFPELFSPEMTKGWV